MSFPALPTELERILKAHQVQPARQLHRALLHGPEEWGYPGGADLSDVGTGKSFTTAAAGLATGRRPCVLCRSAGEMGWKQTFDIFKADPQFIGTYEAVRGGWRPKLGKFDGRFFVWQNPGDIMLILDEAQLVKGQKTMTSAMVGGAILQGIPILAASATLAASPLDVRIAGRITGLHNGGADWKRFLAQTGCWYDEKEERWKWDARRVDVLEWINEMIIPQRGCRMRKADMPDQPGTTIKLLPLKVPEGEEIQAKWKELQDKLEYMEKARETNGARRYPAQVVTATRRKGRISIWKRSELALVPAVAAQVKQCLADGKSVVLFFSYTESRELMAKLLNTRAGIYGGQSKKQREHWQKEFQANRERVLCCNIGAGGASANLQDLTGDFPRETFIFPTDNPVSLGQAPGRVDRNGGQTHSMQWLVCIAGGMTEKIVKSTLKKLQNMNLVNDGAAQRKFKRV